MTATELAEIYTRLGEKDKAFEWLNRALDVRDGQDVIYLKDTVYMPLRGDSRYIAPLHKMGLQE